MTNVNHSRCIVGKVVTEGLSMAKEETLPFEVLQGNVLSELSYRRSMNEELSTHVEKRKEEFTIALYISYMQHAFNAKWGRVFDIALQAEVDRCHTKDSSVQSYCTLIRDVAIDFPIFISTEEACAKRGIESEKEVASIERLIRLKLHQAVCARAEVEMKRM